MDGSHQVPWFPAWGLSLPDPIENVFSVVSVVNEWRTSNRWLLVSFDCIACEVHLWTEWYGLRRNEDSEEMIANTPDVWNPGNPRGLTIILLFWGVVGGIFVVFNNVLVSRPLYRNVPEGADADISLLPGGDDPLITVLGEDVPVGELVAETAD